jgi:hypothetical protein
MMTVHRRALALLLLAAPLSPLSLAAQGYQAEVRVRGDVLELRGLVRDSVPESSVPGDGLQRRLANGTIVTCLTDDFCRWYRAGDVQTVTPTYGDIRFAAWLGVEGLSVHSQMRTRFLSDEVWPKSSQEFDLITGYARYERAGWRATAGRLLRASSLGYRNFDGGSVLWKGLDVLRLEAWGGWSLYPGTNAPRSGKLLSENDVFAPDKRALIYGFEAGVDVQRKFFLSGLYQREIRTDRLALYSERIAADARLMLPQVVIDGSLAYDLAYKEVNSARLAAAAPLPKGFHLTLEGRHYTPFFELWTIWGAFTPVGFKEGRGLLSWTLPGSTLTLEVGGGYRDYEKANAGAELAPMKTDGWRLLAGGRWRGRDWFVDGGYRSETGFGAARYGGDLTVGRTFGPDIRLALHGTVTQTFGEFRVGEQVASGGGLDFSWNVGTFSVSGSGGLYRMTYDKRPDSPDWTQARAHLSLGYRFGTMAAQPRTSLRGIGGY